MVEKIDILFVNTPLKNYDNEKKYNNQTLPVMGLGYLATYAETQNFNVEVLDAEARGMGLSEVIKVVNEKSPRWIGLNLLAPTYHYSVEILKGIDKNIKVLLGGHQTRAMSSEILKDKNIPRIDTLMVGEGELRVTEILKNTNNREILPLVFWRDGNDIKEGICETKDRSYWLVPDVNELPFVNRKFLSNDPFVAEDGKIEANLIGSRGCVYNCSFCGAAYSINKDIKPRRIDSINIVKEQRVLNSEYGVTAFRFIDELFLSSEKEIKEYLDELKKHNVSSKFVWDANGRIDVFSKLDEKMLNEMKNCGLREVAFGMESGNNDILKYINKNNTKERSFEVVKKTLQSGINVKGFFVLGFPNETKEQMNDTVEMIDKLSSLNSLYKGNFRVNVFEFRPYPGTIEWNRIMQTGKYSSEELLNYTSFDTTQKDISSKLYFSSSLNISFANVPSEEVNKMIAYTMLKQSGVSDEKYIFCKVIRKEGR